jgi:tetratricopeptide (TPR) repeat protein
MTAFTARPPDPATDLRLARLHLRMGQLGLARAELEALAGGGHLDDDGLLALAEARWRTGDLTGAGEAAQAYLGAGRESVTALVIAAEAVAAVGRPGEARRIAGRALEEADAPLDRIFAGMPRSSIWPADPADGGQVAATLFGESPAASREQPPSEPGVTATPATPPPDGPGFWDTEAHPPLPDGKAELAAARAAQSAGRPEASLRFAIVLRAAPELARQVLEATESGARSAEIEIVRGDAFGLVGRHDEARRAYAAAAELAGSSVVARPPEEA